MSDLVVEIDEEVVFQFVNDRSPLAVDMVVINQLRWKQVHSRYRTLSPVAEDLYPICS